MNFPSTEQMKSELPSIAPYKTFSFWSAPFRWIFCWILWNLGKFLQKNARSILGFIIVIIVWVIALAIYVLSYIMRNFV